MTTSMSPVGDTGSEAFTFNLNYCDDPFSPGGLQARTWTTGQPQTQAISGSAQCVTSGESITWTQRLSIVSGRARFEIVGGSSTTWGKFGTDAGSGLLLDNATAASSLDGYLPSVSVSNSGAGWQPDRVQQMTLLCVRYYQGDQLVSQDSTPRSVIGGTP
jgi:hypothetical protein